MKSQVGMRELFAAKVGGARCLGHAMILSAFRLRLSRLEMSVPVRASVLHMGGKAAQEDLV